MLCGTHLPDGRRGLGQRSYGVLGCGQCAVGDQAVHRMQQLADLVRRVGAHRQQIGVEERQVLAERVEVDTGVLVDVAFADLHETAVEGQEVEPRPLRRSGQRVEHDVDTVTVGVAADLLCEIRCPRVVHMLNAHCAQKLAPIMTTGGGEDLRSGIACDGDRRLSDTTGRGMNQHAVTRFDPGKIMKAVPRGGVCGGYRGGRHRGQGLRQWRSESCIAGDERAPPCRISDDADPVTDLEVIDVGPDCGHHPCEVHTESLARPVGGEVLPEREQHIGEVHAGGLDRHFDLPGLRLLAARGDELEGVQITGGADGQPHAVAFGVDGGGAPFIRPQRTSVQSGGVPGTVAPRGGVLIGSAEQLRGHRCAVGVGVDVDLGGPQRGVLGADDAQQAGDPAVVEIDRVARGDVECVTGDHVEARRLTLGIRKFACDGDQRCDEVACTIQALRVGFACSRRSDHRDTPQRSSAGVGLEEGAGELRSSCCPALGTPGGHRIAKLPGEPVAVIGGDQQPGARIGAGRGGWGWLLIPADGEQALREDAIAFAVLGLLGAHLQAGGVQHHLAVGVHDVEVRFDSAGIRRDHPDQAVPGVPAGTDPAQAGDAERKQQSALGLAGGAHGGGHRLEAGVQQCRVDAVPRLLRSDVAGQRHFGEQC